MRVNPHKLSGGQVVADFPAGANGSRAIFDSEQADSLYEVSITGQNVRLKVSVGTSRAAIIDRMQPPLRFAVIGNCTIEARQDDNDIAARAWCAVRPVSGAGQSEAGGIESTNGLTLQDAASHVVAIDACTLTVSGVAVALAPGESIPVRFPSVLLTGTAFIRYQI